MGAARRRAPALEPLRAPPRQDGDRRGPECARERTRVRRAVPGLRAGAAPATYALVALNVAAFVAELVGGGNAGSLEGGGRVIHDAGLRGPEVADGEWWRIVTAGVLPAGPPPNPPHKLALLIL